MIIGTYRFHQRCSIRSSGTLIPFDFPSAMPGREKPREKQGDLRVPLQHFILHQSSLTPHIWSNIYFPPCCFPVPFNTWLNKSKGPQQQLKRPLVTNCLLTAAVIRQYFKKTSLFLTITVYYFTLFGFACFGGKRGSQLSVYTVFN